KTTTRTASNSRAFRTSLNSQKLLGCHLTRGSPELDWIGKSTTRLASFTGSTITTTSVLPVLVAQILARLEISITPIRTSQDSTIPCHVGRIQSASVI